MSAFPVKSGDDVMLITGAGTMIRTQAETIRITGRGAVGVKIITVRDDEKVTAVAKIVEDNEPAEEVQLTL